MDTTNTPATTHVGPSTAAPRPKRGIIRAAYDVVRQIGPCDERAVAEYLPIVMQDQPPKKIAVGRVQKILYNAVYFGYMTYTDVTDGKKTKRNFSIAPIEYFNARRSYREGHTKEPRIPLGKVETQHIDPQRNFEDSVLRVILLSAFGVVCFIAGYAFATYL